MNKIVFIILILATFKSCSQSTTDDEKNLVIEYMASTRGSTYSCIVTKEKINIDSQGVNYVSASETIAAKDWEEIVALVDKLNLKTLHEIETTNVESAVDRARIANVVVTLNNKQYESASFDEGNSPKKLEPLINKILALAKTVE